MLSTEDLQEDIYTALMVGMENSWQESVMKAMSARDNQLATAHQVITSLRHKVREQESILNSKDREIDTLKDTVADLNSDLSQIQAQDELIRTEGKRFLEENKEKLEAAEKELEETRARHKASIMELVAGTRQTLEEVETKLDMAARKEEEYEERILELEKFKNEQDRKLKEWNRVSEKMCNELNEAKNKLQSTRYSNMKIKEELTMWKKYSEKVEEERKAIVREKDLGNKVLTAMNKFGYDFLNKFEKRLDRLKPQKLTLFSVPTQTDEIKEENLGCNLPDHLTRLTERENQLDYELKRCETEVEYLQQQNATLREVIKSMKKEREDWERKQDHLEEEAKVSKLEEKMRLLKSNLVNQEKESCIWTTLQEVKSQVSTLKMRNIQKNNVKGGGEENFISISELKNTSSQLPRPFIGRKE